MRRAPIALALPIAALALALPGAAGAQYGPATAPPTPSGPSGDAVVTWNRELLKIVRTPGAQPATIHSTRNMALVQAAVHDAVVSIDHSGRPLLARVEAPRRAARVAAADAAAHDVLAALYPAMRPELDQLETGELAKAPAGARRAQGVHVGRAIARRALAARTDDGSGAMPPSYATNGEPGDYQPTPPAFAPAVFTHWSQVHPFVLPGADQLRPPAPPESDSTEFEQAVAQVESVGSATSTTRTDDQTQAAHFWSGAIQDYWNEIAQTVLIARHADLDTSAQVLAVLDATLADATIAMYDAKYAYRVQRPVTAIRAAGNGDWTPLLNTPPDPSYPGAHSVLSAAAATVLGGLFGDRGDLVVTSEVLPAVQRRFDSFSAAVREAGMSRVWGGVHSALDDASGQVLGRAVGRYVLRAEYRPMR